MKALLFLLLAGSLAMGQDTLILKSGEEHQIRLIEIRENRAVVEIEGVGIGAEQIVQEIPLQLVDRIILADGTIAWVDSGTERVTVRPDSIQLAKYYSRPQEQQTKAKTALFTVHDLGIALIAGSGVLGYINNNKECNPCNDLEDVEDFADDLTTRANWQYSTLIVGAVLMLTDPDRTKKLVVQD